jgi:hypothetical protein
MPKKTAPAPKLPNRLAEQLAEFGIALNAAGLAQIKMLATASTASFSGQKDEICSCDPQIAVRLVGRGYAEPHTDEAASIGAE